MRLYNQSELNTYLECPMKHHLIYNEGEQVEASPAMQFGTEVHDLVRIIQSGELPDALRQVGEAWELSQEYCAWVKNRNEEVLLQETYLEIPNPPLFGTFDTLVMRGGEQMILDFKTCGYTTSLEQKVREYKMSIQAPVYLMLARQHFGEDIGFCFELLRREYQRKVESEKDVSKKVFMSVPVFLADFKLKEIEQDIRMVIKLIEDGVVFKNRKHCTAPYLCQFYNRCLYGQ